MGAAGTGRPWVARAIGLLFALAGSSPAATSAGSQDVVEGCTQDWFEDPPALVMLQQSLRHKGLVQEPTDWVLFPKGQVPFEEPGRFAAENVFGPPDAANEVGKRCCPGDPTWWFYNVTVPLLKPFLVGPDVPGRTDAAVVVLPGGGFDFLAWDKEGEDVALWLNSIGISAFVLRYRVPERPAVEGRGLQWAATIDGQRAMKVVRSRAAQLGINPHRIGVIGFSAGGTLAQLILHTEQTMYERVDDADSWSHRPDFQLLIYPGLGLPSSFSKSPATFVAVAKDDQCTPPLAAMLYYQALQVPDAQPSELHVYPNGRHGYGTCRLWVEQEETFQQACEWTLNARFFLEAQILGRAPKELNAELPNAVARPLLGADSV